MEDGFIRKNFYADLQRAEDYLIPTKYFNNRDKLNPDNIEKVIFNPPATIVLFKDGSKTVVKITKGDKFDYELGFLYAMAKHIFSGRNQFKKFIEKWKEESEKEKE